MKSCISAYYIFNIKVVFEDYTYFTNWVFSNTLFYCRPNGSDKVTLSVLPQPFKKSQVHLSYRVKDLQTFTQPKTICCGFNFKNLGVLRKLFLCKGYKRTEEVGYTHCTKE